MKALTLWQPWASLVILGVKQVETRSWPTDYRGPLAIHAAKAFPVEVQELCWEVPFYGYLKRGGYTGPHDLPRGSVLGVVEVTGCHRITRDNVPPEPERSFGDYTPGRWAWDLAAKEFYQVPFPARGYQRLWEWEPEGELQGRLL
jgi:hypothetical protein